LRRDIRRVALAVAGCAATVQLVGGIVAGIAIGFNPEIQRLTAEATVNGTLTDLLSSREYVDSVADATAAVAGPATLIGLLLGTLWLLTVRGQRLVTTDVTAKGSPARPLAIGRLFVLLLGVQFVVSIGTAALMPLLELFGLSLTDLYSSNMEATMASPIGLAYIVLIGPVLEEIIFRAGVMRHLEPYGKNFAIIMSAVLFGLYHLILWQAAFAILSGLVLGYAAMRYSLKWSIVLHIANNAMAVALSLFGLSGWVTLVVFTLGAIGSVILLIRGRPELRAIPATGGPVLAHTYRIAWSSPILLTVAIVLLGFGALSLWAV
jgi:membrane protease YdiL (CAAX protease family)